MESLIDGVYSYFFPSIFCKNLIQNPNKFPYRQVWAQSDWGWNDEGQTESVKQFIKNPLYGINLSLKIDMPSKTA
ncbi:MAG: hypothetical protein HQK64_05300 [Desulfamplus sp.]|nr:hypothetical protein [Desulfamplus sp.]